MVGLQQEAPPKVAKDVAARPVEVARGSTLAQWVCARAHSHTHTERGGLDQRLELD